MIHTAESLRDAFHYLYPAELPALKRLALMLPPDPVVVNIGAGAGTSGLAFLESRPDLTLYTIDIQDESSPFGCLEGERQVLKPAGYILGQRWHQIHNDSKTAARAWVYGSCDLCFIDGDHSYEGATGDIMGWLPHIKPDGIIAVHDYNKQMLAETADGPHPRPWLTVNRAVDDLLLGKYEQVLYVDSLIAFRVEK